MEILSIIEIWRYLKWLPKFILRKLFSQKRMGDLIIVDVQARHQAVRVNLGSTASFSIRFQIINMSPFDVELDRAEIDFSCLSTALSKQYIKKVIFKSGEVSSLYVAGDIDMSKANQMANIYKDKDNSYHSSVSVHCEFNCQLHSFTKICNNLDGVNVHFTNTQRRESNVENT